MDTAIKCLPVEVQGKLRSGVTIPSLQQCVEELILNSIDAEATCVGVRMDMEAFKVQVIDNGNGMDADSMDCVGNRYHTSKCYRVEDLDNLSWYGFRGEALASLVSLATLVEISSRTKSSLKTHVKIFKDGKGMEVYEAEKSRPSAGTTVVLCNFFYNMPVRRKRLDPVLEGERIRHRVEAISLMHPSVSFTLKNDCTATMLVQLPKAKNTYHRFVQIHGLHRAQKLGEVNITHGRFSVVGHIGREGHYNNSSQFLYVNERLLLKTRIHKLINFLLRKPSTNQKNDGGEQSVVGSPKNKRSQELHGVYVLNIKCCCSEYDISLEPAKTLIEFKDWDGVLTCVEEAVKSFLKRENLTVVSQDEDSFNYKFLNIDTTDQERHVTGTGQQAVSNVSLTDYDIGMKLASDSVHRKSQTDGSFCAESGLMNCEEKTEMEERTAHLEPVKSKEITSECGKEPQSDPLKLEPVCDPNNFGGKRAAFSKPEEQLITISEEERNITPNYTASPSNIETVNNCNIIKQMLPASQDTEKQRSTGKISLSDPYIHECLQAPDPSQINMSVHQQQAQLLKSKDESFAFKRKISLHPDCDRACQTPTQDFAPAIPLKIPKISTCPRVFLRKEPGSLEQFRRVYGKPENLKRAPEVTTQRNAPLNNATGPLGAEKSSKGLCSPTLTVQVGGKKSLAAKLCRMKQHSIKIPQGMEHSSRTDSLQDVNNNSDPHFSPEPVPGCSANFQLSEKEERTTAGDWLLHYDTSLGKMVSVNKVTGLSRYEDQPQEETEVQCTSDITNMAVNVISEMGMEYKCYPFQRDLVLPFVPKSRSARVINARLDGKGTNGSSFNSLTTLYSKWNNPVFVRPPTVGLDISRQQADGLTVKIHNVLYPYRFSKAMIHSMKVIHQVDKKFLACLISTKDSQTTDSPDSEGNLLVLVDQHAAHERVRLENLIADSYEDDPAAPGERRLCSSSILPPLEISVTEEELRLFRSFQPHLQRLGLEVKFPQAEEPQILVGKVPVCFTEKESNELRRGRLSVIRPIVEEYLQEQLDLLRSTGRVRGTLPLTVLKVLASLACHGAIKFNDSLSKDECHSLVASLSSCQLPFQCAHGRPSIAPLVDILHLDKDQKELQRPNLQKLRRMYKAWQLYGNK